MTADNSSKLVPRLRFPEFQNLGEWKPRKLGRIGEFVGGGTPNTSKQEYWDGDVQWFTPTEIKDRNPPKSKRTITSEGLSNSSAKLLPIGTLLITTRASIGDIAITKSPCATNQGIQSLVVAECEVNTFWYQWLIKHKSELVDRASGSTFLEIGKSELKRISALRPNEKEQQKIADCLGSLDDLIAAQGRKLEALRQHKQGLMQQLFPQPGETVPRLRFPEFQNLGEWKPRKLGRIGEFVGGGTPNTSKQEYWDGDVQWFTPTEIKDRNPPKSKRTITSEGLSNSSAKLLPIGTLLITTRASIGDIAITKSPCATNQGIQSLVVAECEVNTFWYQWLIKHKSELVDRASGSTFLEIGKSELKRISALRPNEKEQQKIADCLGSLDDLIAAQGRKLEALRQHKQGLMQQLFPALEVK